MLQGFSTLIELEEPPHWVFWVHLLLSQGFSIRVIGLFSVS